MDNINNNDIIIIIIIIIIILYYMLCDEAPRSGTEPTMAGARD